MDSVASSIEHPVPAFAHATVRDAMHPAVLTRDPATPLVTVAQRMAGEGVHAIVVLGGDPRVPWGVVNDTDLLRHARRVDELTAGEIATRDVVEGLGVVSITDLERRRRASPQTAASTRHGPAGVHR
jgi:CBS-domain-containing membrane protein